MFDLILQNETLIMIYFFTSVFIACFADEVLNKHTFAYKLLNGNGAFSFLVAFLVTIINGIQKGSSLFVVH